MIHVLNILDHLEKKQIYNFCYLDRQAALQYAYKKEFGMINEDVLSATEFGLITVSDKTNALYELNPRARRYRMFKQLEVAKYYGISLTEFLKKTRAECDLILEELQNDVMLASKLAADKEREMHRKEKEQEKLNNNSGRWPGS